MSHMSELDIEMLTEYNSLTGVRRDKYLEEHGLIMVDSSTDENTKEAILSFEVSHKYMSFIIQFQKNEETFEEAFQRMVTEALTMFINYHKELENGEST